MNETPRQQALYAAAHRVLDFHPKAIPGVELWTGIAAQHMDVHVPALVYDDLSALPLFDLGLRPDDYASIEGAGRPEEPLWIAMVLVTYHWGEISAQADLLEHETHPDLN